jgi:hypothetical protein
MQELFLGGFLKTIIVLVICYQVGKIVFKWWLKRKISSHAQKMNGSVDQSEAEHMRKAKGHVSIKKDQQQGSNSGTAGSGDYVDFEEVD